MDEDGWLTSLNPRRMLILVEPRTSGRKIRLYACANCRRRGHLLSDRRSRDAIEIAERFADGLATERELKAAGEAAAEVVWESGGREIAAAWAAWAAARLACTSPADVARLLGDRVATGEPRESARAARCSLIRCVFGNPFRPVSLEPAWLGWRDGLVRRLAEAAYGERTLPAGTLDPGRLAVLADALEVSGCNEAELLGHLRGPGPHVRGCWAVDLLLGRS
jgi:hypothetical protein